MRISVTIFIILISTYIVNASVLDPVIENVIHLKASKPPPGVSGMWKKKTIWKPRWVKEWKSAKMMKPVWRKVWSPVQIREWLPIPKPPPGWDLLPTPVAQLHSKPQKTLQDSQGHDSFAVHTSAKVPLWDPVPYPESQQPPPPAPQPSYDVGAACGKAGCDNSPSHTFNHQQIMEIIGQYQTPEPYQNPDYSETVNHLTRLPPDRNNWRPPQDFQFNSLPEFLVPPKFQSFPQSQSNSNAHITQPPVVPVPKWTPLPPENRVKGHFITKSPDQPYKFQIPEPRNNTHREIFQNSNDEKPNFQPQNVTTGLRAGGDFIQEAQLVGEYHYSEFDFPGIKPEPKKPQQNQQNKEVKGKQQPSPQNKEGRAKPQQTVKPAENPPKPLEDKPKEPRNESKQKEIKVEGGTHVQKKHIPDSAWSFPNSNLNYEQQQAIIRDIFPIFKHLRNANPKPSPLKTEENPLQNHVSTQLHPISSNPEPTTVQQTKQIYPVYERIKTQDNPLHPNHRFSPPDEMKLQEKFPSNFTRLLPVTTEKPSKFETPDRSSIVQLVFPTTDSDRPMEDSRTTTTTEPYEIIFSSSLLSTTEAVTRSPVIIVTPANYTKS